MSTELVLPSLEISGYRGIGNLRLSELGRVNLFVGKNNVGKTALLEAIRLYQSPNPRAVIRSLVHDRGGYRFPGFGRSRREQVTPAQIESLLNSIMGLFHGSYWSGSVPPIQIRVGPEDQSSLAVELPWTHGPSGPDKDVELLLQDSMLTPDTPVLRARRGGRATVLPLEWFLAGYGMVLGGIGNPRAMLISASGPDRYGLAALWDRVVETGNAADVEEALRGVVPDLRRIYASGDPEAAGRGFYLDLENSHKPVPLRNMGDGTNRVFGLTLALIRAGDGVLLIDEVENGLHYSVLVEVWRAILTLASRLNVQVFATTHSWDCITAFAAAAQSADDVNGMLYRLEREPDGEIYAERYTEREVAIAAEQQIEVR